MSVTNGQANVQPKDIAEELLGTITWEHATKGFCTCPGNHLHNSTAGDRDCIVYLDGAATIFCMHQSCIDEVRETNRQLRKAIEDGTAIDPNRKVCAKEAKQKQKESQRRNQLELRSRFSQAKILKNYRWTYEEIQKDTPEKPANDPSLHWRDIVGLFKPEDIVWIGNKFDSGSSRHQENFKTAEDWLKTTKVAGQLTCPAAFKSTSISRSNENVQHRRFLVVESDVLSKDEVGAIFKMLRDEVGLTLRAIVDTAGKSLHGWFEFPKKGDKSLDSHFPWNVRRGLISWLDMEKFSAGTFYAISGFLERFKIIAEGISKDATLDPDNLSETRELLKYVAKNCQEIHLLESSSMALDMAEKLNASWSPDYYRAKFEDLNNLVQDQMRQHLFLWVPRHRAEWFDKDVNDILGIECCQRFSTIVTEVDEALKCYAVGRFTACAFHLMRTTEAATRALGRAIGWAAPNNNAGLALAEFDKQFRLNPNQRPQVWQNHGSFLEGVAGDVRAITKAWRNRVGHLDESYTEERAKYLVTVVPEFMRDFAKGLDQDGNLY